MDDQRKVAIEMDGPLPEGLVTWWEDFLAKHHRPPPGPHFSSEWMGALYASGVFPLQRRREMERMFLAAAEGRMEPIKTVFSIGVDKGGDVYAWLQMFPQTENFIACEIRGTPYSHLFEKAFPDVDFLWLPCSSYDEGTVRAVKHWLGIRRIDALFLDGDKSWFDRDFSCYRPCLAKGATVLFHDVTDEAPGDAWRRVKAMNPDLEAFEIVDTSEVGPALEKEEAKRTAHENWLAWWAGRSCGVGVLKMGDR